MEINSQYFVYMHIKETTGEPFYIGKGKDNRAVSKGGRSEYWKRITNKYGFDVIILEENLSEQEAFNKEVYWINRIGRKDLGNGPLINFTDGGDGASGRILTDEHKRKISKSHIGLGWSEETRKKLTGIKKSKASKEKMSLAKLGKKSNATKIILNLETGIYYDSLFEASKTIEVKYKTLSSQIIKNKSAFIYA